MIARALLVAADIEPYLKLIGLVVAFSIMAINRLLTGLKKSRSQMPPPDATPPHDPTAASMRPDLNAEVKEFLRRAAQQRGGQPGSQQTSRPPSSVPPGAGRRDDDQRKQKRKSQPPKRVEPVVPKLEDSLANRHMTSRLETNSLDERAEQLSSRDKQHEIGARMQPTLDRTIGQFTSVSVDSAPNASISDAASEAAAPQTDIAADIAAALRSPQSIRTAVILNEILARPTDRW